MRTNQDVETKQGEEEWDEYDEEVETIFVYCGDPYDSSVWVILSHKLASSIYREDSPTFDREKMSDTFLSTGSQRTRSDRWKIWNAKGCLEGTVFEREAREFQSFLSFQQALVVKSIRTTTHLSLVAHHSRSNYRIRILTRASRSNTGTHAQLGRTCFVGNLASKVLEMSM